MLHLRKKGFSLIELMVTIAITAILAAIALPSLKNYIDRSRYSEMVTASNPYRKAVEVCYQTTNNLNSCYAGQNGIPPNLLTPTRGLVAFILVVDGGQIFVFPNSVQGFNMINDYYILSPTVHNGGLQWTFSGPGAKYI
jgi:type IV pilus assembly protein PilA